MAPPADPSLPQLDAVVVVEGFNDCIAVHRAVSAPVFVLGGGYTLADAMRPELRYLSRLCGAGLLPRQLVVLTDPDWQGRMFRTLLDDVLPLQPPSEAPPAAEAAGALTASAPAAAAAAAAAPQARVLRPRGAAAPASAAKAPGEAAARGGTGPAAAAAAAAPPTPAVQRQPAAAADAAVVVRHAFLGVEAGTSAADTGRHDAGNVGVEHAAPDTLRACLRRARRSYGTGRREFGAEELQAAGLVGSWDDRSKVAAPKKRRARFCRALGLDDVSTGGALAGLLNRFFSREEYEAALAAAQQED